MSVELRARPEYKNTSFISIRSVHLLVVYPLPLRAFTHTQHFFSISVMSISDASVA